MIVTKELMRSAASKKGGYRKRQVDIAQEKFPGKWKSQMVGANVTDEYWNRFVMAGSGKKKKILIKPKVINSISTDKKDDWSWRPGGEDIPVIKIQSSKKNKNRGKKKANRQRVSRYDNEGFYNSKEWRALRVRVLEKYECKCMMCGRSPKIHGIVIHCDHIEPRSKKPELSLTFSNLQLLCEDCNLGKSNKYDTDWRPDADRITEALDVEALSNSPLGT